MGGIEGDIVHELHKIARKNLRRERAVLLLFYDLITSDLVKMIPHAKCN